ncbi:hypothetical protein HC891_05100 [Candidatus Gracilibacteria bacterium]|nr:hypothetical protein [Candidatus Gracilibacteria bacterium]
MNFDAEGEVADVITEESYPRRVVLVGEGASALGLTDAVAPDAGLVTDINTPIEECLADLEAEEVVRSEVVLDVSRNGVRSTESNAGNSITDSFLYVFNEYADNVGLPTATLTNPVIAVQNGGGIRQNAGDSLPSAGAPGTLSRLDTFNVLPFANFVTVISDITPLDLETILERSAESLPGAGGQFLQIAGFKVAYNPELPVGSRVISATLDDGRALIRDGEVVEGAPTVRVVTNNFTANGGDNYPTFAAKTGKTNLSDDNGVAISYEQAWRDYLLTFPVEEGLPTIQSTDARYAPGGEGRITFVDDVPTTTLTIYLPIIRHRDA